MPTSQVSVSTMCLLPVGSCFAALVAVLAGSCGADAGSASSGQGGTGASGPDGFAVPGSGGASRPPPPSGGTGLGTDPDRPVCGFETLPLERLPAELLLVLDRSTSMITERVQTGETSWTVLTRAVDGVIKRTESGVHWGLKTFPSTFTCSVGPGVEHDVTVNNYTAITATIQRSPPSNANGTPTTAAIDAAAAYLKGRNTPNPKYLLLATDGEPTCSGGRPTREATDIPAAISAVEAAAKAGYHTFVVGLAPARQQGRSLETLNAMAAAGLEPRDGDSKFYSVTSEAELTEALNAIAGKIGSCTFTLKKAPPSPDDVAVDVDGQRISRSLNDGWEYNSNQTAVVLNGSLCESARKGALKSVKITFGCAGTMIPVL